MTSKAFGLAQLGNAYSDGALSNRNKIINGAMVIDQRNAGAAVTADNTFLVDRWGQRQVGGGSLSYQQSSTAPAGFTNSLSVTVATADASIAAGDNYHLFHRIEGFNTADLGFGSASAQSVTLSFWVRSSLTGTFGGCLQNSGANRSYVFQYAISAADTWEYKTITIAGDTSGTWLTTNGQGIGVIYDMGCGTNFDGTANAWNAANNRRASGNVQLVGTLNATWQITGVQLEAGDNAATPFEHRSFGQELALCQRYYWKNRPSSLYTYIAVGISRVTYMGLLIQYPQVMRAAPTFNYSNLAADNGTLTTALATYAGDTSALYQLFTTSGPPSGDANSLRSNSAGVGFLEATAEL